MLQYNIRGWVLQVALPTAGQSSRPRVRAKHIRHPDNDQSHLLNIGIPTFWHSGHAWSGWAFLASRPTSLSGIVTAGASKNGLIVRGKSKDGGRLAIESTHNVQCRLWI